MTSSFFSDLLNSPTDQNLKDTERSHNHLLSDQNRLGLPPKFKSTPPPSLPLSPTPLFSPSSYFSIPPGFSLSELLDSPVLLNSSHVSLITNSTSFVTEIIHQITKLITLIIYFIADFIILTIFCINYCFCDCFLLSI